MRLLLALAVLAGCDATYQLLAGGDYGRVYECGPTQYGTIEVCWDGGEDELQDLVGADCDPTDRLWPQIVGCAYSCPPQSAGCNAKNGCACP